MTPLPVSHGKVETIGFLFSSGANASSPTSPMPRSCTRRARRLLAGIDLLILDGLQPEPHWTHLSTGEAVALAGELGAGMTWLTHFSCRVDYRTLEPTLPANVRLAWDGLKLLR